MASIKKIIKRLTLRIFRVDILTIFLTLIIVSFSSVMIYSYYRNHLVITEFSKTVMERNSDHIIDQIKNLAEQTEGTLNNVSVLFLQSGQPITNNPQAVEFMLGSLKSNPNISGLFWATSQGDLVSVFNLTSNSQTYFTNRSSQSFPAGTVYLIESIDHSQKGHPQSFIYKDKNFKTLNTETFPQINLDVRSRPWFIGAVNHKNNFYWTNVYNYAQSQQPGLTVAKAIEQNNQLSGVAGADISLIELADFFSWQKIGKTGQAFLVNEQGQLIISEKSLTIPYRAVLHAFQHYHKTLNHNFVFEYNSIKYLAYIKKIPADFQQNWWVIIIVPFVDFFSNLTQSQFEIVFISIIILLLSILVTTYLSKKISRPITIITREIDKISQLDFNNPKKIRTFINEIRKLDMSVALMRHSIQSFIKFTPKQIVKQLKMSGEEITLHLEKKPLSILFSEIKDFSSLVEPYSEDKLSLQLTDYYKTISTIILNNHGVVDRYIGESLLAFWGAPVTLEDHAFYACITALRCQKAIEKFNQQCKEQGLPEFNTRFGVHSGEVWVGNIGTADSMNYSVLGEAVKMASRLEGADEIYHTHIIISESVYQQVKDRFLSRPLGVKIYELVALMQADPDITATQAQIELCIDFTKAYEEYENGHYSAAFGLFSKIYTRFPDDYPTWVYLGLLKTE